MEDKGEGLERRENLKLQTLQEYNNMKDYLCLIILVFSSFCFSYSQGVRIYDHSNSDIVSDDLLSVAIDDKGNKWIGTSGFGLLKFDGKKFISFDGKNSGIKGKYVSPVFKDSRGNIWASFSEPGDVLGKYDGNRWTVYTAKDLNVDEISVISICEDTQGAIYVPVFLFFRMKHGQGYRCQIVIQSLGQWTLITPEHLQ